MAIRFFNTMTRSLEEFVPINEKEVRMYTCGPTVHDFAHIGNFRTYVFEDVLRRHLEYRGYKVKQVMNITDVEDKTIRKARQQGVPITNITDPFIEAFFADLDRLNIERAAVYPRATKHVDRMVSMIRRLIELGIGYRSEDGSIYYDISKFPDYGKLAHINVGELRSGARVAQDEYEKDTASDFALWKAWDENDGEVYWDEYEDLGKGRPGWHIECSAMSTQYLGNHFDIHTGGVDNIFPHHQNELAQTEPCTGEKFVNYWMHSEHLQVEGKKMSKSLGNFFTLRNLLNASENPSGKAWDAMSIRYQLLATHYRSRLDFTFSGLQTAKDTLTGIVDFLRRCGEQQDPKDCPEALKIAEEARTSFGAALDDDLNMPEALAVLFTVRRDINKLMAEGGIGAKAGAAVRELFYEFDRVLGLRLKETVESASSEDVLTPEEKELIEARQAARKARDFKKADALRDELLQRGIILEDTPKGLSWKIDPSKR
ncbi:MAG: cysteine--tRNA ligase [bacterium]|nr:cysteine--tRNA ligase [bacterium]